jgi:uncharacterized protein YigA (DUF484 family)
MADQKKATALSTDLIGADAVAAYLQRHPDFLNDHPELIESLTPPERKMGGGVLDMQKHMVLRLREKLAEAERDNKRLQAVGAENMKAQTLVQSAAIALLTARNFEHLIDSITARLPNLLDVEASSLCVENAEPLPGRADLVGIRVLKPGAIDRIVGVGREVRLSADVPGSRTLFGLAAPRVRSMALARLSFGPGSMPGLLALGSAKPDGFAPGQSTELLTFFARIVELCIRRWLAFGT